jgi:nucleoside-diphosphate-sugar epimerase
MSKIYIMGATGMVGRSVIARLQSIGRDFVTLGRSFDCAVNVDLSNIDAFDYTQVEDGSRLLLLSAISSPDLCEADSELAYLVNFINTSKFIEKMIEKNVAILFASSDVVYGSSTNVAHTENSVLNPKGVYARSKYEIERFFAGKSGFHSMRLSYVMGPEDKFISYLKRCYESSIPADIFDPFSRSIISIHDVVDFAVGFFQDGRSYPQVVNLCGDKLVSRLDMAREFALKKTIDIRVVTPDPKFFLARETVIECKSLYLHEVLGRSPLDVTNFLF